MTSVYGVTMYGAKLQIHKQISTLPQESLVSDLHLPASVYLARCTFKALEEMFSSARSIQVCTEFTLYTNKMVYKITVAHLCSERFFKSGYCYKLLTRYTCTFLQINDQKKDYDFRKSHGIQIGLNNFRGHKSNLHNSLSI